MSGREISCSVKSLSVREASVGKSALISKLLSFHSKNVVALSQIHTLCVQIENQQVIFDVTEQPCGLSDPAEDAMYIVPKV